MSLDIGPPKRRVIAPYAKSHKTPGAPPEAPRPEPGAAAEAPVVYKTSWHRRLALWAFAGAGLVSVGYVPQPPPIVHVGTALPPPAPPQAPSAGQEGQAPVVVAQEHVAAAVQHVASGYAVPTGFIVNLPPGQGQLAVHITEQLRSQSDHAIDIVVQAQPQKPSEAQVTEAKRILGEIGQSVLSVFGVGKLAEAGATALRDKGLELAWRKLKHMAKELKVRIGGADVEDEQPTSGSVEATAGTAQSAQSAGAVQAAASVGQPAANLILMRLAEGFAILARLFDPRQAGPQSHTIASIATALGASEDEAKAILQLGPFVETSVGVWKLDAHLAEPGYVLGSGPLVEFPYAFSWQSWGKGRTRS
jgi:hypothetical protein